MPLSSAGYCETFARALQLFFRIRLERNLQLYIYATVVCRNVRGQTGSELPGSSATRPRVNCCVARDVRANKATSTNLRYRVVLGRFHTSTTFHSLVAFAFLDSPAPSWLAQAVSSCE